ncbi:MAG: glycolate oxidase subunit GlcE [Betaproteobacteria bacterium]|nr:MAG: glycolate oxidase subunit GlcE [Betaproteobacteria bacterium]
MIEAWQAQIKAAAAKGQKLQIAGGNTPLDSAAGAVIDTRQHTGIVEYEPNELVIVVRCGTPLADVESAMAKAGQMLAFEPPHFGEHCTIGGVVATGTSGPRRPYAGSVRDFVLGTKIIDGKGDHLSFGGKVMKNVAGFDVSRLLTGSMGTLGVITEISFKCLPLPKAQATRVFDFNATDAIEKMNRWYAEANPITATTWVDGKLYVRLAGAEPAVNTAVQKLGGESLANDTAWWADWREQKHSFFERDVPLHRMSCKSTAAPLDEAVQAIDWGGAQRWVRAPLADAAKTRYWAKRHGGYATANAAGSRSSFSTDGLDAALLDTHAKIKQSFDPYGVFHGL